MRSRLVLAAAALAALALAAPAALAAPKVATLDGKKISMLTQTVDAAMQSNDTDVAVGTTAQKLQCEMPRCSVLAFVYSPAKGVNTDMALSVSWTSQASDMDLYVAEVQKSQRVKIASCGGTGGTSEKVFLPAGTLKKGKTYALIADFYRSIGEKVTSTVAMPGKDTVDKTVPASVDSQANINCTR